MMLWILALVAFALLVSIAAERVVSFIPVEPKR